MCDVEYLWHEKHYGQPAVNPRLSSQIDSWLMNIY